MSTSFWPIAETHLEWRQKDRHSYFLATRLHGKDNEGQPLFLQQQAAESFGELQEAALKAGWDIQVNYAYRSHRQQARLHRRAPNWAAKPGYSTHEQGISVDIAGTSIKKCRRCSRQSTDLHRWLLENGANYGFVNDVPKEPWHFTYVPDKKD